MNTKLPLVAAALLGATLSTHAGEGYTHFDNHKAIHFNGYGNDATNVNATPLIPLYWNSRVFHPNGPGDGDDTFSTALPDEMVDLRAQIITSIGLFENNPHSRLQLGLGVQLTVDASEDDDGLSIITLAGNGYAAGGEALSQIDGSNPTILESDLLVKRQFGTAYQGVSVAHEIGHGIGLNHSLLNDGCVEQLTGTSSIPSIMSYHNGSDASAYEDLVAGGLLSLDDIASLARLYPRNLGYGSPYLIPRLSRSYGRVMGRFLDDDGDEIYGANVLLVDRATGKAIQSRVSGYQLTFPDFPGNGFPLVGSFALDGVPSGSYDLYVRSYTDAQVPTNGATIFAFNSVGNVGAPISTDFSPATVRNITVSAVKPSTSATWSKARPATPTHPI